MRFVRPILIFLLATVLTGVAGTTVLAEESVDSINAWKRWKKIDDAIAPRPLDGPEDILEKAEIIEDRVDELKREKARLDKELEFSRQLLQNLINQKEIIEDLAEVQQGGDTQSRRRIHDLTDRIQREEELVKERKESISGLQTELSRMSTLAASYREKAKNLKIHEGGSP